MKKLVVVENRPWITINSTQLLTEKGVEFYKTIYYTGSLLNSGKNETLLKRYADKTGIEVDIAENIMQLVEKMDAYYQMDDVVFLMNYDLKGDMCIDDFYSRINVKYALDKNHNREGKIWFYTTGGIDVQKTLRMAFGDHVINTTFGHIFAEQLDWDQDSIQHML